LQRPDKNMFDVSDKTAAFIKTVIFVEGRYKQMCLEVLNGLLSCMICLKKNMRCCLQIYKVYFCNIHLSSSRNFPQYLQENLSSYHPFIQVTPSSFAEQEKEHDL